MSPSFANFQHTVQRHFAAHRRAMPWRDTPTGYFVLVSEIMLQQTQVSRVLPKFNDFVRQFPTIEQLARAKFGEVLQAWSGLGYNRRAKFLHEAAKIIVARHGGVVPAERAALQALSGIGPNTAGAMLAYIYNLPEVFIETNIRSVYLHHFFADQTNVSDAQLRAVVAQTLDTNNPRQWYWALMDYGTWLKAQKLGRLSQSASYKRQNTFEGSRRQVRGQLLKIITQEGPQALIAIGQRLGDTRIPSVIDDLISEGLLQRRKGILYITDHFE